MRKRHPLRVACIVALGAASAVAVAQGNGTDPARALERAEHTLPCAREQQHAIERWVHLLGEARANLENPHATEAVRRDAARSVEVLEEHLRSSAEALLACVGEAPAAPATTVAPSPPEPPARDAGRAISTHVHAGAPTQVDGRGHVAPEPVLVAVQGLGPSLDACYESLSERYAIVRGEGHLVFRVTSAHAIADVRLEGLSLGDATFQRCVAQAVRALRVPSGTSGEVQVSVPIRFGPLD